MNVGTQFGSTSWSSGKTTTDKCLVDDADDHGFIFLDIVIDDFGINQIKKDTILGKAAVTQTHTGHKWQSR